jgi:phosphate transport system protein
VLEELDLVAGQLSRTVEALERCDEALASEVVERDAEVDERYGTLQTELVALIARQAPVASDLRLITALLHISRMIERMGDQCVNVAKLVSVGGTPPARGAGLQGCLLQMGHDAFQQIQDAAAALRNWDADRAEAVTERDSEVNDLNRQCFQRAIELGDDEAARAWATAMILVARAFERIGDNTVDIAAHLHFAATGTFEPRPPAQN